MILSAKEHGIGYDGLPIDDPTTTNSQQDINHNVLFRQSDMGNWTPRSIFLDLEPGHINAMESEDVGELFQPNQLAYYNASAATQTRAYYTTGKELPIAETLRKEAEQCDRVKDLILNGSTYGGTGSGLTGLVTEHLELEYPKINLICNQVVPPPSMLGLDVVAIQNHVLSVPHKKWLVELWYDNESLYRICKSHLGIENPSFTDLNKLIAEQTSSLTSARRFGGTANFNF